MQDLQLKVHTYHQIESTEERAKHCFKNEWTSVLGIGEFTIGIHNFDLALDFLIDISFDFSILSIVQHLLQTNL